MSKTKKEEETIEIPLEYAKNILKVLNDIVSQGLNKQTFINI